MNNRNIFLTFMMSQMMVFKFVEGRQYAIRVNTINSEGTDAAIKLKLIGTLSATNYIRIDTLGNFRQPGEQKFTIEAAEYLGDIIQIQLAVDGGTKIWNVRNLIINDQDELLVFEINDFLNAGKPIVFVDRPSPNLKDVFIISTTSQTPLTSPQTLDEGATLSFTSKATKFNTTLDLSFKWYHRNSLAAVAVLIANTSALEILQLQPKNIGYYFCVVQVAESVLKTTELTVAINFLTILPLSIQIADSTFIQEGSNVDITCSAISNKPITFLWKTGVSISTNQVNNRLLFNPINRNHSAVYTCEATAGALKKQTTITIEVNYLDTPSINGLTVGGAIINNSKDGLLRCAAEGYPNAIIYTFQFNGDTIPNNNGTVVAKKTGNYTCMVNNLYYEKLYTVYVVASSTANGESKSPISNDDNTFWTRDNIIIVTVTLGFVLLLLVIVFFICFHYYRHKKKVNLIAYPKRASDKIDDFQFVATATQYSSSEGVLYNSNYTHTVSTGSSLNTTEANHNKIDGLSPAVVMNDNEAKNIHKEKANDSAIMENISLSFGHESNDKEVRVNNREKPVYAQLERDGKHEKKPKEKLENKGNSEKKKLKQRYQDSLEQSERRKTNASKEKDKSSSSKSSQHKDVKTYEEIEANRHNKNLGKSNMTFQKLEADDM